MNKKCKIGDSVSSEKNSRSKTLFSSKFVTVTSFRVNWFDALSDLLNLARAQNMVI